MIKISEIVNYIEDNYPPLYQEKYDNSGYQIFCGDDICTGVLLCLDINIKILKEAKENKLNLVISHHPFLFYSLQRIDVSENKGKIIEYALKNKINVYSLHTNYDKSIYGINLEIAKLLDLKTVEIINKEQNRLKKLVTFVPHNYADKVREAIFKAGGGVIGNYDCCSYNIEGYGTFKGGENTNPFVGQKGKIHKEPETRIEVIFPEHLQQKIIDSMLKEHPYEEVAYDIYPLSNKYPLFGHGLSGYLENPMKKEAFFDYLKEKLKIVVLKYNSNFSKNIIRKIAICSGSGSFLISSLIYNNYDCFITSDLKYHDFVDVPEDILLIDVGHFEMEVFFTKSIYNFLSKKFDKFAIKISENITNPINYY
ncbi:MAG: Nif3-like dinuclear metal center hexameric protein [Bacteroidales bacterium]|nr:Nif3-like dinuclear metal center hexameric protein [Bacteroidales bacterium]